MARYIDVDEFFKHFSCTSCADDIIEYLQEAPTADVVEVETIKSWLYEMAINKVGYVIDGNFSEACEEIISRLDGLRNFARERRDT